MNIQPKRRPVQILSAIHGMGGKNADATAKVEEHVETYRWEREERVSFEEVIGRRIPATKNPAWRIPHRVHTLFR